MRSCALLLLLAALAGCAERPQVAHYKDGRYDGKADGQPWNSQPPSYVRGEWVRGDQASWVRHMRTRGENQDENELMDR